MPSESDDESESDTHIKVPPPPPPTDRGTKESDSNCTSSSDANKGTLHPVILMYCTQLPSNHSFKQITSWRRVGCVSGMGQLLSNREHVQNGYTTTYMFIGGAPTIHRVPPVRPCP